ncbi:esterase-like activity of phytase family protein [Alsobacter sp. R-9]
MRPLASLLLASVVVIASVPAVRAEPVFNRIASFPIVLNLPADRDAKSKTVAEIIAGTADGNLLAYTDAEQKALGLIDITDPARPRPAGFIPLTGEPTSVAIQGRKALVAVDTSPSKDKPSGHIATVDLDRKAVGGTCELGGQPDSVKATADGRFLAIAIENERDETKDKGKLPQLPGGNLSVLALNADGVPDCGSLRIVGVDGLAVVAPEDPEPEFVDVNRLGEAVLTLQENNHLVVIDVASGKVLRHFSAGAVSLKGVDTKRDGIIDPTGSLDGVKREPDGVAWLDDDRFVTANEGDYEGGSRGFTIFRKDGTVEYDSGTLLEHAAIRLGHYPERRSGAKGTEPEGVEAAVFGSDRLFFVGTERASLVFVFRDRGPGQAPELLHALPAGAGPEGLLALPQRDLLVVTSEVDGGADGLARPHVMIYRRAEGTASYPTIQSGNDAAGLAIGWGALSGLAAHPTQAGRLFAVTDSAYATSRILAVDASRAPAQIAEAIALRKDGKAVGYDIEGIAVRPAGGFWLASEGNPERKEGALKDILLRVAADGSVEEEILLPDEIARHAVRFGFEGVAVTGSGADETVWLAVQREWKDDPKGFVKILSYVPATKTWGVYRYPLDTAKEGWVGLSELTALGDGRFVVIERDNQFGDAAMKTLRTFSVKGLKPAAPGAADVPVVAKSLLRDLAPDLKAGNGYVLDKIEGFTVDAAGNAFVVSDNDGVDGSSGETRFIPLGPITR